MQETRGPQLGLTGYSKEPSVVGISVTMVWDAHPRKVHGVQKGKGRERAEIFWIPIAEKHDLKIPARVVELNVIFESPTQRSDQRSFTLTAVWTAFLCFHGNRHRAAGPDVLRGGVCGGRPLHSGTCACV